MTYAVEHVRFVVEQFIPRFYATIPVGAISESRHPVAA